MENLTELPELAERLGQFGLVVALFLGPDAEADFLDLVADLVEAGREVESRGANTSVSPLEP